MTDNRVWFITGAGRGMGIDIAKAALAAGHAVVATGRDADRVRNAIGEHDDLLAVALDITDPDAADAAAQAAVERFGRIDVLVNNAGNFYAGFFEEISPAQYRRQMETNFFGPLNVTRAILPMKVSSDTDSDSSFGKIRATRELVNPSNGNVTTSATRLAGSADSRPIDVATSTRASRASRAVS